jgi:GNAT superfamily N-acetyltransferase
VRDDLTVRPGAADDVDLVLGLFDEAVEWLVARGRPGQWGTEPFTGDPRREQRIRGWAVGGGLSIGELAGRGVGALATVEQCPSHVPPVERRELYVDLLITSRRYGGRGIGAAPLDHAHAEARSRGIDLLRVECWAGGDGSLVRHYTGQGFLPTVRFEVDGWIGQVFEQPVR